MCSVLRHAAHHWIVLLKETGDCTAGRIRQIRGRKAAQDSGIVADIRDILRRSGFPQSVKLRWDFCVA